MWNAGIGFFPPASPMATATAGNARNGFFFARFFGGVI
jgi:hypothetical protein